MEAGWPGKRAGSFTEMEIILRLHVKKISVSLNGLARFVNKCAGKYKIRL